MATRSRDMLPQDLAQAHSRFQAWRARHPAGARIPPTLWDLAVRLVHRHGVSRTATALGLNYHRLKERAESSPTPTPSDRPTFLELPAPLPAARQALFRLDDGAGTTLRLRLAGYDAADLQALVRCLRGER